MRLIGASAGEANRLRQGDGELLNTRDLWYIWKDTQNSGCEEGCVPELW